MACKTYSYRKRAVYQERSPERLPKRSLGPIEIDFQLGELACKYATAHGVTLGQLIECALVNFMMVAFEPVPIKVCATHNVVMECNSSGTQNAVCPVNEGSEGFKV